MVNINTRLCKFVAVAMFVGWLPDQRIRSEKVANELSGLNRLLSPTVVSNKRSIMKWLVGFINNNVRYRTSKQHSCIAHLLARASPARLRSAVPQFQPQADRAALKDFS
jgi:hypothetical protein